MSFSGLKTFAANTIAANGDDEQTRADIAQALRMQWSTPWPSSAVVP